MRSTKKSGGGLNKWLLLLLLLAAAPGYALYRDQKTPGRVLPRLVDCAAVLPVNTTDLPRQAKIAMSEGEAKADLVASGPTVEQAGPSGKAEAAELATAYPATDQPTAVLDEITFGAQVSEQKHGLKAERSESFRGGLEEPARKLLPGGSHPWEGGTLEWTMTVDPEAQNYVTVKLWGSDKGKDSGRLVMFANGLEVGYRVESDYDVLNQCDEEALAPGRFVYVTLPLPPKLTQGKTRLDLKIVSLGPIWYYGATFEQEQKDLIQPTRGIYCAYTHTASRFVPAASEKQGEMPVSRTRSTPGKEVISESEEVVKSRLGKLLASPKASPRDQRALYAELLLLGGAYNTRWTPACRNPRTIDQIVRDGDALVEDFAGVRKDVEASSSWPGAGPLGQAIMETWPAIGNQLDVQVKVGSTEMPRREAWAKALGESVDYWRTHRRSYTNQSMIVDTNIYTANRALQLIKPGCALPEARALHYLYQAAGIEPWLGSDLPGGGSEKPYGEHYYLISRKGLSRELGYVGTYGETILSFTRDMAILTGDDKLREQLRKMQEARLYFRYPGFDGDGYRCMKLVSEIDNRTAHYPLAGSAYNAPGIREAWWMETAALLVDDPVVVGAAQQSVEEGQYFAYIESRLKDPDTLGMMRNVDEWGKVSLLPQSPFRLPMTPGQPDFAFADEENAVLSLKHGDTCLFINFYYRAERAVNRVARVFELTPEITRLATVRPDVEIISSGETYERPDWIDRIRGPGNPPPGEEIHQAWAGDIMPIARRPDDARAPAYGDWGPFVGKAAFYALRYGDYLIGMNTTGDRTYSLHVPAGYSRAPELITHKVMDLTGDVAVSPLSTVVLYLGKADSIGR